MTAKRCFRVGLYSSTRRQIDELASRGEGLCFLDMPLLFEKGYDKLCDTVWTVWLPEEIQITRLMERDGLLVLMGHVLNIAGWIYFFIMFRLAGHGAVRLWEHFNG